MTLVDIITVAVIAAVLGLAVGYIIMAKKKGKKCIGCRGNCSCCGKNHVGIDKSQNM